MRSCATCTVVTYGIKVKGIDARYATDMEQVEKERREREVADAAKRGAIGGGADSDSENSRSVGGGGGEVRL